MPATSVPRLSLGGLVGFPYPPANADGAAIAVETARNIWLYQYMIVAGAMPDAFG